MNKPKHTGITFNSRYRHKGIENDPPQRVEPSKAKQEFRAEADIQTIMSKYERTGLLPRGRTEPIFGDFTAPELADYQTALHTVDGARDLMTRLPAKVRDRFRNDPMGLLLFVQDPKNRNEALELGLINAPPPPPAAPPAPPAPNTPPPVKTA